MSSILNPILNIFPSAEKNMSDKGVNTLLPALCVGVGVGGVLGLTVLIARQINCPNKLPDGVAQRAKVPIGTRGRYHSEKDNNGQYSRMCVEKFAFSYWKLQWVKDDDYHYPI